MDSQPRQPTPRAVPMRPPKALVLRDAGGLPASAEVDWTKWYLTDEEDMGSSFEQQAIILLLLSCLEQLAFERSWTNRIISTDVFFAWVKGHPLVRVSPDVFVLEDPPEPLPRSIQTWREGHHAPSFAVEVVSLDWEKDYDTAPEQYAQLGCRELLIFDPEATDEETAGRRRHWLTLYRRASDGAFAEVYAGPGPVHSAQLDAWLVVVNQEGQHRLRLARDAYGVDLVPTTREYAQLKDERAAAAEARVRELEEQLRKLKGE